MDTATPHTPGETTGTPEPAGVTGRFQAFRHRHHLAFEVAFFFAGFLFDVVLLHRIDSTPLLIHQGTYLVLTSLLVFADHKIAVRGKEPEGVWGKIASYRLWVMHFFLGTLLNAFIVFYFRASSGFFGLVFICLLATVMVANELPQFRKQGPAVRVALLSFSITSYLAYLLPVLYGELRPWQYVVSVVLGGAGTYGLWRFFRRFTDDPTWTVQRAVVPGLVVQALLLGLYFAEVIPPVPLSVKHIGVYYGVEVDKSEARRHYLLKLQKPAFLKFWAKTQDELTLGPGEKAWAFVRIFAPAKFQDHVSFAWEYDDPQKGWTSWGKPFSTTLTGGNEEGFRTFANTTVARSGTYRVRVLTADNREIGRTTFDVKTVAEAPNLTLDEERD